MVISLKLITWQAGPACQAGEVVAGDLWSQRSPRCRALGRRLRASGRSPCSRAFGGAGRRRRGGRSSPKRSSRRRSELGLERLRGGYRARGSRREGGTDAGAHGGFGGVVGELGEGLVRPEGRRRSRAAGDEDDAAEDKAELARVAWLGEEGEGVAAELWSVSGRCGSGRGHGGCGRRRRAHSAAR